MSRFEPTVEEARRIMLAQQDRAEGLASRIVAARAAVTRGKSGRELLDILDGRYVDGTAEPA